MAEQSYTVSDDTLDDILDTVRDHADSVADQTFRAGMIDAAEHYDRLLRERCSHE